MALAKSAQTVQASATNAAAATTTSSAFAIGYGASGVARITNGATGPGVGCDFVEEVSNDGGTTWFELRRRTAGVGNSAVALFRWSLAVAGGDGDWTHYRHKFVGNTGQPVTVQSDASSTTAL